MPRAHEAIAAVQRCANVRQPAELVELVIGTRHELGISWLLPAMPSFETVADLLRRRPLT